MAALNNTSWRWLWQRIRDDTIRIHVHMRVCWTKVGKCWRPTTKGGNPPVDSATVKNQNVWMPVVVQPQSEIVFVVRKSRMESQSSAGLWAAKVGVDQQWQIAITVYRLSDLHIYFYLHLKWEGGLSQCSHRQTFCPYSQFEKMERLFVVIYSKNSIDVAKLEMSHDIACVLPDLCKDRIKQIPTLCSSWIWPRGESPRASWGLVRRVGVAGPW